MNIKKLCAFAVIFFMLSVIVSSSATWAKNTSLAPKKRHVLVINSYHPGYRWSDEIMKAIRHHFDDGKEVEIYIEYLDSKRRVNPDYWPSFLGFLKNKFADLSFDLVISADNNAFTFVTRYRDEFLPGVPLVFCGFNNFQADYIKGMTNLTGVNEQVDVKGTVDTILTLHPEIRSLIFYMDTITATAAENNKAVWSAIPQYKKQVNIEVWRDLSIDEIRARLRQKDSNSILLWVGRVVDEEGSLLLPVESLQRVALNSNVPIYSLWDFFMECGVVGGKLLNGYDQGRVAARLTRQILDGTAADSIPVVMESPTTPMFDYNALMKYDIPLERLPENSVILNRPFSFYETYKVLVWISVVTFVVLSAFVFFLLMNVQHRKKTERELRRSSKQLEENNRELEKTRLAAEAAYRVKGQFLENMSHEIRTPMNAILGFSDMLQPYIHDEIGRKYLNRVITSGGILLRLIDDILSISALEAGKVEIHSDKVSPHTIIDELNQIYCEEIRQKGLELIISIPESLPKRFVTDESHLRQILLKLLGNAVKFTKSGHVGISVQYHMDGDENQFHFSIEDTGPGIEHDQLDRIFNAFEQQEEHQASRYGGSGLGLTIAKQLAEMLNGEIRVSSEVGRGSTFTLTLNNVDVVMEKKELPEKNADNTLGVDKAAAATPATVLIVDDIEINCELIGAYLEGYENLTIVNACNGKEGIDKAREYRPDLILLDIKMPIMDGYQAAEIMKNDPELKSIPRIALTASTSTKEKQHIEELFDAVLIKPVSKDKIIDLIDTTFGRA